MNNGDGTDNSESVSSVLFVIAHLKNILSYYIRDHNITNANNIISHFGLINVKI